ncbi:hypothetical protein T492DRAFT_174251 [Pavlovales sp. CCMP2436]|nr:hypothetical protein T492DRAFT_174251 [Pavlovales sp. CCMP2436]
MNLLFLYRLTFCCGPCGFSPNFCRCPASTRGCFLKLSHPCEIVRTANCTCARGGGGKLAYM